MNLEELEEKVAEALLSGDDPVLETLRQQYAASVVSERDLTGVGVFIHFDVPANVPRVRPAHILLDDVFLDLERVEHGVMAMLFVNHGKLDFIEMCTVEGDWPDEIVLRAIGFSAPKPGSTDECELGEERDLEVVRKRNNWAG